MEWIKSIDGHFRTVYRLAGARPRNATPKPDCETFVTATLRTQTARRVAAARSKVIVQAQ